MKVNMIACPTELHTTKPGDKLWPFWEGQDQEPDSAISAMDQGLYMNKALLQRTCEINSRTLSKGQGRAEGNVWNCKIYF